MKRSRVFLLCVLAFILVILWAGFSKYTLRQNVIIHATIDKVAMQFINAKKWSYWHPDLVNQSINPVITKNGREQVIRLPDVTYLITEINPAEIQIDKIYGHDTTQSVLTAASYKDGTYTYVDYAKEENGFTWLKHKFSADKADENLLRSLQSFTEDESRRYGFTIKVVPVIDTLILTTGITTTKDSIIQNTFVLYQRLINYCRQNSITLTHDYYYTSASLLNEKQATISVGLPVQKEAIKQQADFRFLKLPVNGHLVVGEYKGKYADKQQLYAAMDKYIQDKRMKKVARPLEQYNVTDTLFADSSGVSMRLFYPVF